MMGFFLLYLYINLTVNEELIKRYGNGNQGLYSWYDIRY
jgi:hypothetical protein